MATTLDQVCEYLRRDGWQYLVDADAQVVRCRRRALTGRCDLEVRIGERGDCLHLRVPAVVTVGDSPHKALLTERILELHYQIKIGRFGLGPGEGDIDCEVILPLEDAPLTYRQFTRCVTHLTLLVEQQRPRFRAILARGEDPERDEREQVEGFVARLAETLGVSADELLDQLARELGAEPAEEP